MRVAFWVKRFPNLYETFILNQILKLREAGIQIDVIATERAEYPSVETRLAAAGMATSRLATPSPSRRAANKHESARDQVIYEISLPRPKFRRLSSASLQLGPYYFPRPRLLYHLYRRAGQANQGPLRIATAAAAFLNNRNYDLVHCQFGHFGMMAVALRDAGVFRCPIVTSFRGYDLCAKIDKKQVNYAPLFESGDAFTPVCQSFADKLHGLGCPQDKINVVHSPIDCSEFHFQTRLPESNRPISLLSIGRLAPKKGFQFALQAMRELIDSGLQIHYSILGEGSYRQQLEQLIERLNLGAHVSLHGWLPHADSIAALHRSHIFLQPSARTAEGDMEGIPNALKEAMATGMPVIATRHSGIPELVDDGMSGYLVPEGNAKALTICLQQLLGNPESWHSLGQTARERVLDRFDVQPVTARLLKLYNSVASN